VVDTQQYLKLGRPRRSLFYILLIGVISSVVLFSWVRDWEQQRVQVSFEAMAASYIAAIDSEISRHQEAISSVANFHQSLTPH